MSHPSATSALTSQTTAPENTTTENEKIHIVYWSDYACPFCYIGERQLMQAMTELGMEKDVELEMRCFELNPYEPREPEHSTVEVFSRKYGLSMSDAQDRVDQISQLGRDVGIDFRYASVVHVNTFDAHRLMKLVESKGDKEKTDKVIGLLYDAYFTRNVKLTDPAVLVDIGAQVGVGKEEIEAMLASDAFSKEVREDEKEAMKRNIHGVPYFVFNGAHPISGAPGVDQMKRILSILRKKKTEAKPQRSYICTEDGCILK